MKQTQASEDYVYDYVSERGREINGASNPIEIMANEAYGMYRQCQDDSQGRATESQAMETFYEGVH